MSLPSLLSAQQLNIYPLDSNFSGQGKVIELQFPDSDAGLPLYIVWQTGNGQLAILTRARAGQHAYEMRNRPHWEEQVASVGVSLQPLSGRVKQPTYTDDIDMFLQPALATPSTVNVIDSRILLGWPENVFLLVLAVAAALAFSLFKKTGLTESAILGFLVAWGILSAHEIYDHVTAAQTMQSGNFGVFSVADLNNFAEHASGLIGSENWNDDLTGLGREFLHYDLAEHPYAPANSQRIAAFRITQNPNGSPIVWQHAGYFLVKNTPH